MAWRGARHHLCEQHAWIIGLNVEMRTQVDELGVRRLARGAVWTISEPVCAWASALDPALRNDCVTKFIRLDRSGTDAL